MRLKGLRVNGFRAFGRAQDFDLDADAIVVVGANGQGKTSLFDAILWGLAGTLPRLQDPKSVISIWSDSGEARVELELRQESGDTITIARSFDGSEPQLRLQEGTDVLRGREAETRLLRLVWPESLAASDPLEALCAAVQRAVYLQQDRVTEFIDASSESDRFTAISELVGAGRITELQLALERSRTAWSTATNTEERQLEELRERERALEEQRLSLDAAVRDTIGIDAVRWRAWWSAVHDLLGAGQAPEPEANEAPTALDAAVKQLQMLQGGQRRREESVRALLEDLRGLPPRPEVDEPTLRARIEEAERNLVAAREALVAAQKTAAEIRRAQVEATEARQQLQAFAELALRHLGERCPVCEQLYDEPAARARLEAIVRGGDAPAPTRELPDIGSLAKAVEERERAVSAAQQSFRQATQEVRAWQALQSEIDERLKGLDVTASAGGSDAVEELARVTNESAEVREKAERLVGDGERFALDLAQVGQEARLREVEAELAAVREELQRRVEELRLRQETKDIAEQVLAGLRDATADVVEAELSRIEPLLQRIYAAADPHPAFRAARLLSRMSRGRGRIAARVIDPVSNLTSEAPGSLLSSSQLNVLAVSVFLSLNLGMSSLPLESAILDDPLQSLDDLNLLGLIDVLRRTRERRQLLVSTHDARFGGLLGRKLRPIREGQRTLLIELEGWGRTGPLVRQTEITRDFEPLRIAA
jgi:DNA repair exonuclease SbcCD ATPase subunit